MTDVRHERYAKSISRLPTAVPTNNIGPQSQSVKDHMTKIIKSDAQKGSFKFQCLSWSGSAITMYNRKSYLM